jgi:hypothetical protein
MRRAKDSACPPGEYVVNHRPALGMASTGSGGAPYLRCAPGLTQAATGMRCSQRWGGSG